ncbi:MAG TPA: DUF4384 domain-containing protein [Bryobacteraceae bacterium]|nr:DUF4384 domain-containing protein [Bryobacteraceae bacterium]
MFNYLSIRMPLCVAATLAAVFTATAQDAPKGFTARELFYSAGDESSAKPTAAKPAAKPAQTPPAVTKKPVNNPVASNGNKLATPSDSTGRPPRTSTTPPVQSASATAPDGSPIIRAHDGGPDRAPAPANGPALGLKITVLKRIGSEDVEVAPDTVFHAGDRIRFSVQTNGPGYLYIVSQGSSGTWKPLFPSPDVADGDNHVDGWHPYAMPPKSRMVFDEQTGTEKVFIVFSKQPEQEFENMIYSLPGAKGQTQTVTPEPTKPASQPASKPQQSPKLVMASVTLPDSAINKMRQTYTRDLIIEKVDDNTASTPGQTKEKAIFVVNPTGSNDPRVVADLSLVHQ